MTRLSPTGERIEGWDNPRPRLRGAEYRQAGTNGEEPPTGFDWQGERHHILEVCNCWRVHARWWEGEQAVWREYFKVTTDSGLLCLIYHDLQAGDWFLTRVYD